MGGSCRSDMAARLCLLLLLGLCQCLRAESRGLAILNKRNLIELAKFSRDTLAIDVNNNWANEEQRSKATEAVMLEMLNYVDKTIQDRNDRLQEALQDMVDVTMRNMKSAVLQNKISHNLLQNLSQENEDSISRAIATNINRMSEEVEQRMRQHEQLLSTSVEACGGNYQHYGQGVVSLNTWNWNKTRIGGVATASPISRSGFFTVPEGGEGTYRIAFSVIIDTVSDSQVLLNPSYFTLRLWYGRGYNQILEGSRVTAIVGTFNRDLVPASKEVLVDLKVGESIALNQEAATAGISYNITFCAHLVKPLLAAGTQWESISDLKIPLLKRSPTSAYKELATRWHSLNSHSGITPIEANMPQLGGILSPRHRFMKFARTFPVRQEEDVKTVFSLDPASTSAQRSQSDIPKVNVSVAEVQGGGSGDEDLNDEYGDGDLSKEYGNEDLNEDYGVGDQLTRNQTEMFDKLLQTEEEEEQDYESLFGFSGDSSGSGMGSGD